MKKLILLLLPLAVFVSWKINKPLEAVPAKSALVQSQNQRTASLKTEIKERAKRDIPEETIRRLDLGRLTRTPGLRSHKATNTYVTGQVIKENPSQRITGDQTSQYQTFVTPTVTCVKNVATNAGNNTAEILKKSQEWVWMSDGVLNGTAEKWLLPKVFLEDTPSFSSNPIKPWISSDCESHAYTLVSALRAAGWPPEDVRVVLGLVNFSGNIGGHAWVQVYYNGGWLELEPSSGNYFDENSWQLVQTAGLPSDYFLTTKFPSLEIWYYFNDVYFYDVDYASGNAPANWSDTDDPSPAVPPTTPTSAVLACKRFFFSPNTINVGEKSNLSWEFQNYTKGTDTVKLKCTLTNTNGIDVTGVELEGSAQTEAYSTAGTETCEIFFNGSTTAACTTDPSLIIKNSTTKVDGQCGTANRTFAYTETSWGSYSFCSAGTANPTSPIFPTAGSETKWTCQGSSGGSNASCQAKRDADPGTTKVNGQCGTADRTFAYTETTWGSYSFCSAGTADPTSPIFPATGSKTSWTCKGSNGGSNDSCQAERGTDPNTPKINGHCGTADRSFDYNETTWGNYSFCSAGTADPTSPAFPPPSGEITWTCKGSNGGNNDSCKAERDADPNTTKINGKCGTADRTFAYTETSWGSYSFCSAGTADPTSPIFPATGSKTKWTCKGISGGSNASCQAEKDADPNTTKINGKCGTADRTFAYTETIWGNYSFCSAGTADPLNPVFPNQGKTTSWTCKGTSGGSNDSCQAKRDADPGTAKVNGQCGTANRIFAYTETSWGSYSFCSAGTADPTNPIFPSKDSSVSWNCIGANSGTNASCRAERGTDPNAPINPNDPKNQNKPAIERMKALLRKKIEDDFKKALGF